VKITFSKLLGYLQIFIGVGAIAGGIQLIILPDGSGMGMSTKILEHSPFTNFLIPGITLFIVIGLGNFFGSWLSLKKKKMAGIYGSIMGATLISWMLIQIILIGWGIWLQPFYLTIGTVELICGFILFKKIKNQC
jgi:hypothetical protein